MTELECVLGFPQKGIEKEGKRAVFPTRMFEAPAQGQLDSSEHMCGEPTEQPTPPTPAREGMSSLWESPRRSTPGLCLILPGKLVGVSWSGVLGVGEKGGGDPQWGQA